MYGILIIIVCTCVATFGAVIASVGANPGPTRNGEVEALGIAILINLLSVITAYLAGGR